MSDYNVTGITYNSTRKADPHLVHLMRAMLNPRSGLTYLDIGCGTGNYTAALSVNGTQFIGVDPSTIMLHKAAQEHRNIIWTLGTAEQIPYKDEIFSGALASLTLHHWANLKEGFLEIYRTLRPKSHLVVFTATAEQMRNYWLNQYFPEMMEKSIAQMPSLNVTIKAAQDAGFILSSSLDYFVKPDLQDLFLYSGKHKPRMYLDGVVRSNISSFASLSNDTEVTKGLIQLSSDLDDKNFKHVKDLCNEQIGDYILLQFSKV